MPDVTLGYWSCYECDRLVTREDSQAIAGLRYCNQCAEEIFFICERCERYSFRCDSQSGLDGETLCDNCFNEVYFSCAGCGEVAYRDNARSAGYDLYCETCYDNMTTCDSCGRVVVNDDEGEYDDDGDSFLCRRCARNRGSIRDYSYKPQSVFRYTKLEAIQPRRIRNRRLYFGVEVEMECKRGNEAGVVAKKLVTESKNFFYCKSDGSLSSNGFEAVSHPFSFDWMLENAETFEKLFDCNKSAKSFSTSNCGMHVHMSRDAFTQVHLFKFAKFFYDNPDFVFKISGRHSVEELSRYADPSLRGRKLVRIINSRSEQGSRNKAINFYSSGTIECRIFKGTISRRRFFANIEFLHGLYVFSRDSGITGVTIPRFMAFMQINRKSYPHFFAQWGPFKEIIHSTASRREIEDIIDSSLSAKHVPFSMVGLNEYLENVMEFIHGTISEEDLSNLAPRTPRATVAVDNQTDYDENPCHCPQCEAERIARTRQCTVLQNRTSNW